MVLDFIIVFWKVKLVYTSFACGYFCKHSRLYIYSILIDKWTHYMEKLSTCMAYYGFESKFKKNFIHFQKSFSCQWSDKNCKRDIYSVVKDLASSSTHALYNNKKSQEETTRDWKYRENSLTQRDEITVYCLGTVCRTNHADFNLAYSMLPRQNYQLQSSVSIFKNFKRIHRSRVSLTFNSVCWWANVF